VQARRQGVLGERDERHQRHGNPDPDGRVGRPLAAALGGEDGHGGISLRPSMPQFHAQALTDR
jgi:hypothetical protein